MKKINQIIIAVTLVMFTGQSFAALSMSCVISVMPNTKSEVVLVSSQPGSGDNHYHRSGNTPKIDKQISLKQASHQSNCDSEQHECQCSMGTCSVFFLPVKAYTHPQYQTKRVFSFSEIYSDFQPAVLYRPPISA